MKWHLSLIRPLISWSIASYANLGKTARHFVAIRTISSPASWFIGIDKQKIQQLLIAKEFCNLIPGFGFVGVIPNQKRRCPLAGKAFNMGIRNHEYRPRTDRRVNLY